MSLPADELARIAKRQAIRARWLANPAAARTMHADFQQAVRDCDRLLEHLQEITDDSRSNAH